MSWHMRECAGCGVQLAATTGDPAVKVMCLECDPSDLPVYVDPERERKMREMADPAGVASRHVGTDCETMDATL